MNIFFIFLTMLLSAPIYVHAADSCSADTAEKDGADSYFPLIHEIPIHDGACSAVYSPSGHQLAVGGNKSKLSLIDTETGTCNEITFENTKVYPLAYHPAKEGHLFVETGICRCGLWLYNIESDTSQKIIPKANICSMSGDGKKIAGLDRRDDLLLHDLESEETQITKLPAFEIHDPIVGHDSIVGHDFIVNIALNSDGTLLALLEYPFKVYLYNVKTSEITRIFTPPENNTDIGYKVIRFTSDDSSILFSFQNYEEGPDGHGVMMSRIMKYDLHSKTVVELHSNIAENDDDRYPKTIYFDVTPHDDVVLKDSTPYLKIIAGNGGSKASEQIISNESPDSSIACNQQGTQIAAIFKKCVRLWNMPGCHLTKAARSRSSKKETTSNDDTNE